LDVLVTVSVCVTVVFTVVVLVLVAREVTVAEGLRLYVVVFTIVLVGVASVTVERIVETVDLVTVSVLRGRETVDSIVVVLRLVTV
jgi:uncharacterized protein involved in response to NO